MQQIADLRRTPRSAFCGHLDVTSTDLRVAATSSDARSSELQHGESAPAAQRGPSAA